MLNYKFPALVAVMKTITFHMLSGQWRGSAFLPCVGISFVSAPLLNNFAVSGHVLDYSTIDFKGDEPPTIDEIYGRDYFRDLEWIVVVGWVGTYDKPHASKPSSFIR